MIEVEEYTPFLIGLKLNPGIQIDFIIKKMKKVLESNGYDVPIEQPIGIPLKIGLPIEILGQKKNVEVRLNLQTESFNIIGEIPGDVKSVFEEILGFLNQEYEDLDDLIPFYELIATLGMKTEESPLKVLTNSVNLAIDDLKDVNQETSIIGIRIGSLRVNLEEEDNVEITIEPKRGSYSNRYQVKIRYQSKDKNRLLEFPFEDQVVKIVSSLEKTEN